MKRALVIAVLAACGGPSKQGQTPLPDPVAAGERDARTDLVAELQDDILKSYDRDEPPESVNGLLVPEIGPARIGVGPGDVLLAGELARAPSRWPLDIAAGTRAEPRSKRLEIHLSRDQTAAWAVDEISWRIHMCSRIAVIPLRMTALFARDGDRWVPVFEHLSFARTPMPTRAGQKQPREITTAVASRDLADDLSRVLTPVLRRTIDPSSKSIARGPEMTLLGPDLAAEWHGAEVAGANLMTGASPMKLEDRRVGVVGRTSLGKASIAYWVGNITAELPARPGIPGGKGHFRGTFVFERRDGGWVLVQGHVSHAIEDGELASAIFGTALLGPKPLAITCDDGTKAPVVPVTNPARGAGNR
ncbi:MAG: nuclear transport factor 2 family protein [Kofleriaceae bacterium]